MQNGVHMAGYENKIGNVMADKGKIRVGRQMRQVLDMAGDEVIHPDDLMSPAQK